MPAASLKGGRYEIRKTLGQGGMGVVYVCYDTVIRREVALKTIRDTPDKLALEMFYKECNVLAGMSHPNIVEIFDIGELEDPAGNKPYFVMPLLAGQPLDELIRSSSQRLTVERTVDIICQTCRGLQAAHERGLVHRDIKPSNIFVLNDDSVKIIDFGVAHMAGSGTSTGAKGTLYYMAPEQIQLKAPSALTDIFSLGVVAYQAFTLRRPFEGATEHEVASGIVHRIPPPASELNPAVNQAIGRVIHKAMAKQPWHRFASARDLADALQKAARNEPLELFDPARIRPRVERAGRAFEQGDYQFASEIVSELEAEGYLDPAISSLRRQLDHAVRRKTVTQLLESARTRMEEEEYPLALQKVQEALQLDPENADALGLRNRIEAHRGKRQVEEWFRLAQQHLESFGFAHARQALQNVLQVNATDSRALDLMAEVQRREQEYLKVRNEKQKLYDSALHAYERAELTTALSKLQRVLELDEKVPDISAPERGAAYHQLYNKVRSEHDAMMNAYAEARHSLDEGNFVKAASLCEEYLKRYPGQALFQALRFDVEEQRRQKLSAYIVEVDRRAEAEPDADKRFDILREAAERFPEEEHFQRALRLARDKRDLVRSIEDKARHLESRGQFAEALAQWEILRTIYSQYPGLEFEIERVAKRRDQQTREGSKLSAVEAIDGFLESGEYQRALDEVEMALEEFPGDTELTALRDLAVQGLDRAAESQAMLQEAHAEWTAGRYEEAIAILRRTYELDTRNAVVRAVLVDVQVKRARALADADWSAAGELVDAALALDANNAGARSLRGLIEDRRREEYVEQCVSRARQLQAAGDVAGALALAEEGVRAYPSAARLTQLHALLKKGAGAPAETAIPPQEAAAPPPPAAPAAAPTGQAAAASAGAGPGMLPGVKGPSASQQSAAPPPSGVTAGRQRPATGEVKAPVQAPARSKKRLVAFAATLAVMAAVIGGVVYFRSRSAAVPEVALDIRTVPPGANILINQKPGGTSNCRLNLPVGSYEVQAVKPGFRPAVASLTLREGVPGVVDLTLEPMAVALRVFTDLDPARLSIDDQPAVEFQGGQFVLDRLPEGRHTVRIAGRGGEAVFPVEITTAAPPQVAGPLAAKDVSAVVVTNLGGKARVHSSLAGEKLELDGKLAGQVAAGGLDLGNLAPGGHELAIGEGKQHRKLSVEIGSTPWLTAFLSSDRESGTLVVVAEEDGVTVWVDGNEQRRVTKGGQLRIPNLAVKQYTVRVAKQGFQDTAEQAVEIRKGEDSRVVFQLKPVPTVASLLIEGAAPGAQVAVDGNPVGAVGPDGGFSMANIAPGEHGIEISKDQYRPRVVTRRFPAGETVRLSAGDVALEAIPKVPVAKPSLPKPIPLPPPVAVLKLGMESWANPAGWQQNGQWYLQRGGEFILYRPTPMGATFVFTAMLQKGRRLRWVVRHMNDRNHVLFEMDEKLFYRKQVTNGRTAELAKTPHNVPRQQYFTCTVELKLAHDRVVHRLRMGDQWTVLDDWTDGDANFTQGPFGFVLHGRDEMLLSNFSVTPAQ